MSLNSQIADLILEKGRATAQGQAASGAAYGSALSQIGQTVADIPKQIERAKVSAEEQRSRDARNEFAAALRDVPTLSQEGVSLFNTAGIGERMNAKGFGPEFLPAAQHLDGINAAKLQFRQAQQNVVKQGAAAVAASGNDPIIAGHFLDTLKDVYPAEQVQQFRDLIKADPANVAKLTAYLAGPQKAEILKQGETGFNPLTHQPIPGLSVAPKPTQHVINGQLVDEAGNKLGAAVPKQVTPLTAEETALKIGQLSEINGKLNGTIPMSEKDKAELRLQRDKLNAEVLHWKEGDESAPSLTPEGLDIASRQWAMTGQMVPMGMGKAGAKVRTDIINHAADVYKGLDLPSQQAAYKANQASLVRTTGTLDNLTAFEKAANKNIDMFTELAKKLPDSGVPWANIPLRLITDKMVGAEYMPAINLARQIAMREVARVTNDPGLKGELTDSARKSVDAMVSGDITIPQLVKALPTLKQDMANVHTSLSDQVKDIAGRIATPPGGAPPTSGAPSVTVPDAVLPGFEITRGKPKG